MVRVRKDLTGCVFDRLTVIEQAEDYISPSGTHYPQWLCECSCSEHNKTIVRSSNLISKTTKSCGCLNTEKRCQRKKNNKYKLFDDYGVLWLTNTNEECYFDLEDTQKILNHTWYCDGTGYAITKINGKNVSMHQLLGYFSPDHHNKNKLDSRKTNLIICTSQENARNRPKYSNNTSGITGVGWDKRSKKWRARIYINDHEKLLGYFNNKEDAIIARLKAEKEYFGEFAPQKHLFKQYEID